MRSDHLKSHMKKHVDLSSEDPEQICKSILEDVINDIHNKDETSMYRKKPRLNDLNSDGMDESPGDEIEEKELDKILAHLDNEYAKKRKLGSQVTKLILNPIMTGGGHYVSAEFSRLLFSKILLNTMV